MNIFALGISSAAAAVAAAPLPASQRCRLTSAGDVSGKKAKNISRRWGTWRIFGGYYSGPGTRMRKGDDQVIPSGDVRGWPVLRSVAAVMLTS